jgi:hypothetical protein
MRNRNIVKIALGLLLSASPGRASEHKDRRVIVIREKPELFVFHQGETSVDFRFSYLKDACTLEADFPKMRASIVCGGSRWAGDLRELPNHSGSLVLLPDPAPLSVRDEHQKLAAQFLEKKEQRTKK